MRITENGLRRIIREVILEAKVSRRRFLKNIVGGLTAVLASDAFKLKSVYAKPLTSRSEISFHVNDVLNSIGYDQHLSIIIKRAITSVDRSEVSLLKTRVLKPWVESHVKVMLLDQTKIDRGGKLKHAAILELAEELAIMISDFKIESIRNKKRKEIILTPEEKDEAGRKMGQVRGALSDFNDL